MKFSSAVLVLTTLSTVSSFAPPRRLNEISMQTPIDASPSRDATTSQYETTRQEDHHHHRSSNQQIASLFAASTIMVSSFGGIICHPLPAWSASSSSDEVQGIAAVTKSELGQSVRRTVIGGAQLADTIDLKWERFSDSLRDEKKCDPRTNRRMFDNGTRKDGTKIGNPVLGALCTPEPLGPLDATLPAVVSDLALDAMKEIAGTQENALKEKENLVKERVAPAFDRAIKSAADDTEELKRQEYNRDLYTRMRAYGEILPKRESSKAVEKLWGNKILSSLAPNANRDDYTSPFPKPDPTDDQPYDETALLDALGAVSVTLDKMKAGGLIGHWEISIPEDDYWNVVTIAVDDDISIGGQMLARESNQSFRGSSVVALVRSAMEDKAKISYKIDTFFIDPTTTKQELYNPTQLLVSLSDLGQ